MSFKCEREVLEGNKKVEFIYPSHEIDSFTGEELRNYVCDVYNDLDGIVINFSDITYLNSSGLRELIQLLKFLKEQEKQLVFSNVNEEIYKIFVHTNLNRLFDIVKDDDEAKASILK